LKRAEIRIFLGKNRGEIAIARRCPLFGQRWLLDVVRVEKVPALGWRAATISKTSPSFFQIR
jgi:hypothetical protein